MRDFLEDLHAAQKLSDPDPVRRAQILSKMPLPKRFYKAATFEKRDGAYVVLLDGKPVRAPGRDVLSLPTQAAAGLVADEFAAQTTEIDPVSMPVLRIANSVIDGVAKDPKPVAEEIARFAGTDLIVYRSESPVGLVERQSQHWDPVLDWAKTAMGVRFILAGGIVHVAQPPESLAAVARHVEARSEPFRLATLHVMTTLTGSALLALAVEAGVLDADAAWAAAHVDEDWQIEQWGEDHDAQQRRLFRKREMMGAYALLRTLDNEP
ncbi:MAG: ATP12 family protein [Mesorhizobium sp.]